MDGESKMLVAFVAFCFTVVLCVLICSTMTQEMASKGYCQEQAFGTSSTIWVKCK